MLDYGYSTSNKRPLDTDSQCVQNRVMNHNDMMRVFMSLRDQNIIQIVLSLLAKIQNSLRDESAMELIMPFLNIWPVIPKFVNHLKPYLFSVLKYFNSIRYILCNIYL